MTFGFPLLYWLASITMYHYVLWFCLFSGKQVQVRLEVLLFSLFPSRGVCLNVTGKQKIKIGTLLQCGKGA